MALLTLRNITVGHGGRPLFENASFSINRGERVALIGRNGVGKSTLLKLIQGEVQADNGSIDLSPAVKIAYLQQTVPFAMPGTVFDIVASGMTTQNEPEWEARHLIDKVISKLALDANAKFDSLSGGLKRRVLLAKTLVTEPDILLLDEPTNHLDIESITWLEKFLLNYHNTIILVTHDRILMEKLATHIVEIDNGQVISWHGHYQAYLKHKVMLSEAQTREQALFDKKLAQEETWIRQGIKARRTRNEGRVRALEKMREQYQQRRSKPGQVSLRKHDLGLSGKIVFEVDNISYRYDDTEIIKNFSTLIMRGDKVGIIGPNGSGKTTLLNLLLDKLAPNSGSVKHGTKLNVAYLDQHHTQLDDSKTVIDNVAEGSLAITIGDKTKHIMSYLQDFLFSPERARTLIKSLSGGERNRVMLAKLFTKPCNVLVLDEPTNDLDVETLELLEEQLLDYSGTLLLVSHDRAFLDNVVTSTLVMEGQGFVGEYVGGYDDWLRQRKPEKQIAHKVTEAKLKSSKLKKTAVKLSYHEQRELKALPKKIETLEHELDELQQQLSNPDFYTTHSGEEITAMKQQISNVEQALAKAYHDWEVLEQKNK